MPDPSAHSPLSQSLRQVIAGRGPLPFRDFMEKALYDEAHGFYGSGRAAIGRHGDFFTSVSVGPLFGALLARQFAQMWERLGKPARFDIVEQGAHRGDFARDMLGALRAVAPECLEAVRLIVVEPGRVQREAQAAALEPFAASVAMEWAADVESLPPIEGVHFSNELIDAFPVHVVTWSGEQWQEQYVDWRGERFVFVPGALSEPALEAHLALLPPVPAGYTTEINPGALQWVEALGSRLRRGFVLAIDYGFARAEYYRADRREGTLSAYARHERIKDVLQAPGEIDLTAHVDFTTLVERAEALGLRLHGFTDQHHFMVGLSRLHFEDVTAISPARQREMLAFKTLMHPTLLGQNFKALCLEKNVPPNAEPLAGFSFAGSSRSALGIGAKEE